MVRSLVAAVVGGTFLVGLCGCATYQFRGEGGRYEGVYVGNVGILGEDHELTLLDGSHVPKLSIIGNEVRVRVRPGALVEKVEIIGEDNEVTYPANMSFEYNEIGGDNRLRPE